MERNERNRLKLFFFLRCFLHIVNPSWIARNTGTHDLLLRRLTNKKKGNLQIWLREWKHTTVIRMSHGHMALCCGKLSL